MTDPQNKGIRNVKGGIVVTGCKPMTPDAQQPQREHPQRCETCRHYNDETETEYGMCYAESGHREQMYNNTFDHVSKFGCASHSTRPHTPTPLPNPTCPGCNQIDVADRVLWLKEHDTAIARTATLATLDDIIKFRKDNAKEMKIHDMWVAEAEYLKSLRRTAQEQQR